MRPAQAGLKLTTSRVLSESTKTSHYLAFKELEAKNDVKNE